MQNRTGIGPLPSAIDEALDLLAGDPRPLPEAAVVEPLPSLLAQCQDLIAALPARPVIRTLHHFACTGGTLIAKCVAALPNTVLLSEIDPLSTLVIPQDRPVFAPTDVLLNMRQTTRPLPEEMLADVFVAAIGRLAARLADRGQHLVLRDHAHSHYCTHRDPGTRPSLRRILAPEFDIRAIVTVRDPVESYLSLRANGWHTHMAPQTPAEYARRYRLFLDDHRDLPVLKYEEFTQDPEAALRRIADALDLGWSDDALHLFPMMRLTGDSGRKGDSIAPRPRKPVAPALLDQLRDCPDFLSLRAGMGYEDTL